MNTPKKFVQEFKKSYDYPNSKTIIDAKDQQAAETTLPVLIVERLSDANDRTEGDVATYVFEKGTLTVAKKDANLFSGFFTDSLGQIVEKFDSHTIEMIAKTLMVKGYFTDLDMNGEPEAMLAVPAPIVIEPPASKTNILIRIGDVEIELRKSMREFVGEFKKNKNTAILTKALTAWRRTQKFAQFESNTDAAKEILENWETHKESFNQTMFAIKQLEKNR